MLQSFMKLTPKVQARNPVMFTVFIGAILCSSQVVLSSIYGGVDQIGFVIQITVWLWLTVLFANFAEAVAEGRGKAQAQSLRQTREEVRANKLDNYPGSKSESAVRASELRRGDIVYVAATETIPGDGEVIEVIASVDESAIT